MEPNRFFFKLIAIFLQYVLLIAILFPLIYLAQLLKYNFKADEIYLLKILFLAIAIAMPFAVANAFSFANYEKMEITNYLKAKQKHKVSGPVRVCQHRAVHNRCFLWIRTLSCASENNSQNCR